MNNVFIFSPIWLLGIVWVVFSVVRWLRWVAIAQQKEYRLDRLAAYLSGSEGRKEMWLLIPGWRQFSRAGLKRPHLTGRAVLVLLASGGLLITVAVLVLWWWHIAWMMGLLLLISSYVGLPALIWLAVVPTAMMTEIITHYYLVRASQLLKKHRPLVIGIGGCYGKTTTKLLLHAVLQAHQPTFTTPLSHNTRLSVAKSILKGYRGQAWAIIEYGTYKKGEISALTKWFPINLAMETGFTEQHLSLFGSIEAIYQAEGELAAALPADGIVFCHAADPGAVTIAKTGLQHSHAQLVPYTGEHASTTVSAVELNRDGQVSFKWLGKRLNTKLVGKHYLPNVLGAMTVARYLNVPEGTIRQALADFEPNDRFIRTRQIASGATVIDDGFAANPQGFAAAIELLAEVAGQRKARRVVVVFAGIVDLGEMSDELHQQFAHQAAKVATEVIYTSTLGLPQFRKVFGEKLLVEPEQQLALLHTLNTDDVLLIEGRVSPVVTRALE